MASAWRPFGPGQRGEVVARDAAMLNRSRITRTISIPYAVDASHSCSALKYPVSVAADDPQYWSPELRRRVVRGHTIRCRASVVLLQDQQPA